jgi:hypothetical protein
MSGTMQPTATLDADRCTVVSDGISESTSSLRHGSTSNDDSGCSFRVDLSGEKGTAGALSGELEPTVSVILVDTGPGPGDRQLLEPACAPWELGDVGQAASLAEVPETAAAEASAPAADIAAVSSDDRRRGATVGPFSSAAASSICAAAVLRAALTALDGDTGMVPSPGAVTMVAAACTSGNDRRRWALGGDINSCCCLSDDCDTQPPRHGNHEARESHRSFTGAYAPD